ncbi:MAG: LamG domain-containing protein [Victivallaceae bacterium]|nr:LamG domain-containing protein [Victivallaceae bacterium]
MNRFIFMVICLSASVFACTGRAEEGLVAYWNFDEGKGGTAHDISGEKWYYNNGVIHNPQWSKGIKGNCLLLGKDSYVEVPHSGSLVLKNQFTFEAWVKPVNAKGFQIIMAKGNVAKDYCPAVNDEYFLGVQGKNMYALSWKDEYIPVKILARNNHPVNMEAGKWNYLAVTGDGKIARFYRNGKLYGFYPYQKIPAGINPLYIGCDNSQKNFFNGCIDELRIYNKALSSKTIKEHYRELTGGKTSPVTCYVLKNIAPCKYIKGAILRPDAVFDAIGNPAYRENLHLYLWNPDAKPLEIAKVLINGKDISKAEEIIWHTVNPRLLLPGHGGEIMIRYSEVNTVPLCFDLELADDEGKKLAAGKVNVDREAFNFRALGFNENLDKVYLYLRPDESLKAEEILLNGKKVTYRAQNSLEKNKVNPVILNLKKELKPGDFVLLEVRTDKGRNCFFTKVRRPFFSIGMYRCYKYATPNTPAALKRYEKNFGKWAKAYLACLKKPGEKCAVPAWLDDCRKHFINTILPDYLTWPNVTQSMDEILKLLQQRNLKLVDHIRLRENMPGWTEKKKAFAFPDLLYYYLADEPYGIEKAHSVAEKLNLLRKIAPGISSKLCLCELGPNIYDFSFADSIDYDVYPVVWCSLTAVDKGTHQLAEAMAPKPTGFISQAFRWSPTRDDGGGACRFPLPGEARMMVYGAVANGAKAVSYFTYNIEPGEPTEGVGNAAWIGIPEAVALWEEIGRINLELATLGPWLMRGCVMKREKLAGNIALSRIGVGDDTVILILTNKNYRYTRQEFQPHPIGNCEIVSEIPAYLKPNQVFELSASGIKPLSYEMRGKNIAIPVNGLKINKVLIITSNKALLENMRQRRAALINAAGSAIN